MTEVVGVIVAAIGAIGAIVAAYISGRNSSKLDDIHVMVNSNLRRVEKALSRALQQIEQLKRAAVAKPKRR